VLQAAAQMQANNQSTLAVLDNGRCVGILTSKDIIEKAVARGLDPRLCYVEDIMRRDIVCCYDDDELEEAALSMQANGVSAIVVMDRTERPAGVISLGEVIVGAVLISTHDEDQEMMGAPLN
jgi:CBS domain-containing protein